MYVRGLQSFRQEAVSAFARKSNVNDRTTTYSGSTLRHSLCLGQASKEHGVKKSLWIIPPITHEEGGREVKLNTGYITVDIKDTADNSKFSYVATPV